MAKQQTMGEILCLKPGAMAAKSKRQVAKARAAIAELSRIWDDVYQPVTFDAEALLETMDRLGEVIDEGATYLRQPPELEAFDV